MENKITDLHSLQLEKQRLKMLCANQEKEMMENFKIVKHKLTPSYIVKEALIEIVPKDFRNNSIVSFVTSMLNKSNDNSLGLEIFNVTKSIALPLIMKYVEKFIEYP
jgi:hypothetical protein